jgi:lycopene cyclase domain-containing protein
MMSWAYLTILVAGIACMVLVDFRWRLVLWSDARRAVAVLVAGFVLFLAWDLIALRLGLYRRGDSPGMTGLEVAPDLPVEEFFFIVFLCYLTLTLHRLVHLRLVGARSRNRHR